MSFNLKKFASIVVTVAFIAMPFVAIWQRQAIFDWWRLRDYTPSSEIQSLANKTTLTDYGRHLLYVYHAQLQEKEDFNQSCKTGEKSIVLGCYVDGQGIYIYNVTDERLAGIQEVTAAHEVLHAAYERLNNNERKHIDSLTENVLKSVTNQRILDAVQAYRDRDPSIVPNELHSIIGTEVEDIPSELEAYYSRYFHNRKTVVGFSSRYEKAFTEREQKAEQIHIQIDALKQEIDLLDQTLTVSRNALEQEYTSLQSQRPTADPGPYNARVRSYNARVQAYNVDVRRSYGLVDQHNNLVNEYNQVVIEENELIKAINSRATTIDTE